MAKGSDYEREICNMWSRWWTEGRRDDIFWRAAGSGNRAKVRGRGGRNTAGQHGDICATDPTGALFIDLFTVEIKRGYSSNTVQDILDKAATAAPQEFDRFFDQILESYDYAGSYSWMLIHRRDRREAMVWHPRHVVADLRRMGAFASQPTPFVSIAAMVRRTGSTKTKIDVAGMRLVDWLKGVQPKHLQMLSKEV